MISTRDLAARSHHVARTVTPASVRTTLPTPAREPDLTAVRPTGSVVHINAAPTQEVHVNKTLRPATPTSCACGCGGTAVNRKDSVFRLTRRCANRMMPNLRDVAAYQRLRAEYGWK